MGIRGLTGWIRWAAPKTLKHPDWSAYAGKTVGVDILGQLYKVKAQRACPLLYMAQFIAECKKHNITPLFVFDGKPPDAKRAALKQRSELRAASVESLKHLETHVAPLVQNESERTALEARIKSLLINTSYFSSEERDLCKQLCYACGVVCLNATGEADDVLAHLYRNGTLSAIISCDLDMLARGIQDLFVPDLWAMPGDADGWVAYCLPEILTQVQLSYDQFVEMCVLMGSDYNVGQRALPYRSAYWAIKYRGELLKTLEVLGVNDETPYYDAIRRLKGMFETEETLMGEKQWSKLSGPLPPIEHESLSVFRVGPLAHLPLSQYTVLYGSTQDNSPA